jgi:hypothetical protein
VEGQVSMAPSKTREIDPQISQMIADSRSQQTHVFSSAHFCGICGLDTEIAIPRNAGLRSSQIAVLLKLGWSLVKHSIVKQKRQIRALPFAAHIRNGMTSAN